MHSRIVANASLSDDRTAAGEARLSLSFRACLDKWPRNEQVIVRLPEPRVFLRSSGLEDRDTPWLEFIDPVRVLETSSIPDVSAVLRQCEQAADAGLHAAGFVSYEAAAAFDPALTTRPRGDLPLAWFGLFRQVRPRSGLPAVDPIGDDFPRWDSSLTIEDYRQAVSDIRKAIERGETYQANFTFRLRRAFAGDCLAFFARLIAAQPVGHAAYVDLGDHVICSASPELFFRRSGSRILTRPMKGTAARGMTLTADRRAALALWNSQKDRAENLMIVDMLRNDLGRIATPGSVNVTGLFNLEKYASVHQLTSEIQAETSASIPEIFAALFPSASITGAPKVRTMELLAGLEREPRGIYTGAVGSISPGRNAEFNVAIRTVHIDRRRRLAEFGTGGGIVWDSDADLEYKECQAKASVLTLDRPDFELFETLRWDPATGFFLLSRHLDRLAGSADYFDFPFDRTDARNALERVCATFHPVAQRVRLHLLPNGTLRVDHDGTVERRERPWRLALAKRPVATDDVFLYHKTTNRNVYDGARSEASEYDDVLLWNEHERLTESSIANVVMLLDERRVTPPIEDGLLAGTLRSQLVDSGDLEVRSVMIADLARAKAIWLLNSIREWIEVDSVDDLRTVGGRALWRNPSP